MSKHEEDNPWRSLDALLQAHEEGALNQLDLFSALLGLLDLVQPDVICDRLPKELQTSFATHARTVVETERELINVITKKPLPAEAFKSLAAWVKLFPL